MIEFYTYREVFSLDVTEALVSDAEGLERAGHLTKVINLRNGNTDLKKTHNHKGYTLNTF